MNPSRLFIMRPVATALLMVAIVLAGALAYRLLPVSALPQVDYPTIQVVTFYPGASPDVMASSVTAPLERQFGQMPGLNQMTSTSSGGSSVVTLQFSLDLNLDIAEQQVQAAINAAATFIPRDLPNPPVYNKVNPADAPILTLALTSNTLPLSQVEDLAETRFAQKISQLTGVGLVSLSGGQRPAVRIQANPRALSAYGLTLEDLRIAVAAANVNQAKGAFDGPRRASIINATDQLLSSRDYRPLIVAYRNGAPVHLSDVADVVDDVENVKQAAWMNEQQAILVNIQRQPGANVIDVADRIKALLPQLQSALPSAVQVTVLTDRTTSIRASVRDVQFELMLAVALVILVIFLFLRTLSATIIPAAAVPLSLVGTFGVMYLMGFSLNNLTLMALTISTGFVVDDAIVMIENISRYIEEGESPLEAALKGSKQIAFTILSLTISLIAVLIPLLFMGDVVGRLFREFAITLSATILVSAVVSLTLTPMMCARLLRHRPATEQGRFYRASQQLFDRIIAAYGRTLRRVLQHQSATLVVAVGTLVLTVLLYIIIPKGFFPVQDTGAILGISEAEQSISFSGMVERQQALARTILADPAVASLSSFIGVDGTNTTLNSGRIQINLKPMAERGLSVQDVIHRLQAQVADVEGMSLFLQPMQDLTVEDRVSRTQYQYTLEDADPEELSRWAPSFVTALQALPELRDVSSDQLDRGLAAMLVIDRSTASRLGISPQLIVDTLYDAFGQRQVSTMFTQLNQYRVVLEVMPEFQTGPQSLQFLDIRSITGGQVPLNVFTQFSETTTPLAISRQGQFPVVTVSFNLAPGKSLGDAVSAIEKASQEIDLPVSIRGSFQGTAQAFQASLANEVWLILAALVTVYIVLGILYESYIHPLTILSTLPSAGVGALLALMLFRIEFSVIALIGIILLIGIVKKNAIMMIDFALDAERKEGKTPEEAIYEACLLRFRPIMMTTMAALLGALPLAIGSGVGSELRHPLGIAIIGGLIVSQVLTLYTTPVVYLAFDRLARRVRAGRPAPSTAEAFTPGNAMNISAPFIQRPVATTLLTIGVTLLGIVAFRFLPVAALPQVEFPTINVSATLPGGSPETMATSVAAPLEHQFTRIAGVTEMTSTSMLGSANITLQFDLSRNIDGAARDVQAAIMAARSELPTTLPNSPTYRKINPADAPVLILSLTSDLVSRGRMYDVASSILQQKLSQIEGVGQVTVGGGSLPAIRVDLNPTALNSYGIGLGDVRRMLNSTNVNRPKGQLSDGKRTWEVRTNDQLHTVEEYLPLIVSYREGRAVRLSDIATVEQSVEDLRTSGVANGVPAVLIIINRQPGANIIETVDRVRAILPQLEASIPGSMTLKVVVDRTPVIRASLHDVERTLAISVCLVILVVFLFLRDIRATLIPCVAVPVSLISTFGVMYLFDYSLDNLSLMALTIATGFVVDDAIVVLENISRYREQGMAPMQAALRGAREITFTVLSMTVSLVAVFLPILFMGGMMGRLFREFAVTLSVAILVSLVVSLTTTPMMCARLLKAETGRSHGRWYRMSERFFEGLRGGYAGSLGWVLRHPRSMLVLTLATMVFSIYLYTIVPKGFFPQQDTGRMFGNIQAAQDISFQAMRQKLIEVVDIIKSDPAVDTVTGFSGGGVSGNTNAGRMFISLKPLEERQISVDQVIARLRPKLAKVTGAPTVLQAIQDLRIGGRASSAQYQYTLQSVDLAELNTWAPKVERQLRALPEITDVNSDQQDKGLQSLVVFDRSTASRLGISPQLIDDTLYDAFGQRQVSIMYTPLNQYHVVMEVAPQYWQNPSTLQEIYVRSPAGAQVPLSAVTRYEPTNTLLLVNHQGQFPGVTLSFNMAPGASLGDAVQAIEKATREMGLPAGVKGTFQGAAKAFQASVDNQPFLILAALVTVYIVLGILYESYIHPLTILSTLPSAGVGALLALLLFKTELSMIALIGIILLIGIVKKNAIMMIDFALDAERKEGKRPEEAIYEACLLRFRPIMMTTMAALFGALPLALGTGVGSELRRPLGIAIVGGLLVSQLLTLYTTPVIYLYLDRLRLRLSRMRRGRAADRQLPPGTQLPDVQA